MTTSDTAELEGSPRDPAVGDPVLMRGRIVGISAGTATVAVFRTDPVGLTVAVQCGALELDERSDSGVEPAASEITCDLTHPVTAQRALTWAKSAPWFFHSYHKYTFTFEAYCTVAYPGDLEAHEVKATAEVYGETGGDIYRFEVSDPMTWDEISYPGTPEPVIRDGDTVLYRG